MTTLRTPRPLTTAPRIAPRARLDEPRRPPEDLAAAVAFAVLEFEAGRRPLEQFARALSPALALRLAGEARARARTRSWAVPPTAGAVGPCLVDRPREDVCEVAVVVRTGPRAGVLAVRVERHRGTWRVVELARP